MKFIHTSDWHIGRLFQNIQLLQDQLYALKQIKNYAKEHKVDAIVIAGDIFDRSVPPAESVDALNTFFNEIKEELDIPIIMISGNHDSAQRLGFGSEHMSLSGLHILNKLSNVKEPVVLETSDGPVHFYGIPYHDPVEVREDYGVDVKTYDEAHSYMAKLINDHRESKVPAVLISHCFITGGEESDSERTLSIGGADQVSYAPLESFDYVALGHLHSAQFKGHEHIRYSGSLLKYSFSEYKQEKGVTLVEIKPDNKVTHKHLNIIPKYDMRIIEGTLDELIIQGKSDKNNEDYIFARLTDENDLLDPLNQLRKVYPNTLQLERTRLFMSKEGQLVSAAHTKRDETDVFIDFFDQVIGTDMTDNQSKLLEEVILEARSSMEEK